MNPLDKTSNYSCKAVASSLDNSKFAVLRNKLIASLLKFLISRHQNCDNKHSNLLIKMYFFGFYGHWLLKNFKFWVRVSLLFIVEFYIFFDSTLGFNCTKLLNMSNSKNLIIISSSGKNISVNRDQPNPTHLSMIKNTGNPWNYQPNP